MSLKGKFSSIFHPNFAGPAKTIPRIKTLISMGFKAADQALGYQWKGPNFLKIRFQK